MGSRIQLIAAASFLLLLFPASARCADTFTLSVAPTGPPFYTGKAGDAVAISCDAYVQHAGTGDGAGAGVVSSQLPACEEVAFAVPAPRKHGT